MMRNTPFLPFTQKREMTSTHLMGQYYPHAKIKYCMKRKILTSISSEHKQKQKIATEYCSKKLSIYKVGARHKDGV